jgi:hypothetical protein
MLLKTGDQQFNKHHKKQLFARGYFLLDECIFFYRRLAPMGISYEIEIALPALFAEKEWR